MKVDLPENTDVEFQLGDHAFTLDCVEAQLKIEELAKLGDGEKPYAEVVAAAKPWLSEQAGRELSIGQCYSICLAIDKEFRKVKSFFDR